MLFVLLLLLFPLLFLAFSAMVLYSLVQGMKTFGNMALAIPRLFPWSLAMAVLGYNVFAYRVQGGIGFGLFGVAMIAAIVLSMDRGRRSGAVMALAGVGTLAGLAFGFRASDFVQGMNAAALLACIAALFLVRAAGTVRWHGAWFARAAWDIGVRAIIQIPLWLRTAMRIRHPRHPALIRAAKTVILTLAVLLFFTYLLSSADLAFDQLVARVREEALQRIVVSLLIAGALSLLLTFTVDERADDAPPQLAFLGFSDVFVPVVSLAVLFAFFLFVQAKYLFGDHADFQSLHITYADYVRKGFIELLVAAAFGSLLSYVVVLKQRALSESSHALGLRVANGVLIVELFALLLSALKRDAMYMEMYGLTRVRVVGEIFLAWLAGILLLLLIFNLWQRAKEKLFLVGAFSLCAATLAYVNAVNLDAKIAAATPPRGQPKDIVYIAQLSPDAVDGWVQAIDVARRTYNRATQAGITTQTDRDAYATAKIALSIIDRKTQRLERVQGVSNHRWQQYNWSERHALQALQPYRTLITCLAEGFPAFQVKNRIDLSEEEAHIVYDNESPLIVDHQYSPDTLGSLSETHGVPMNQPAPCP